MHAEHLQAEVVVGGEVAEAVDGESDRDAGQLGELRSSSAAPEWVTPPPA